jgi:hypothetical protein
MIVPMITERIKDNHFEVLCVHPVPSGVLQKAACLRAGNTRLVWL